MIILSQVSRIRKGKWKIAGYFLRGGESYSAEDREKHGKVFNYNAASINLIKSKEIERPILSFEDEIKSLKIQKPIERWIK